MKHTRWREINEFLTFTLFRYIAIIPVDGKDMAITRSENNKKELIIITTCRNIQVFHHAKTQIGYMKEIILKPEKHFHLLISQCFPDL